MDPSTATSLVQVSVDDRGVALLQINRPEKRNALSQQTIDCLVSTIAMIERDEKVRAAILTGSRTGGALLWYVPRSVSQKVTVFVGAGADLSELLHLSTAEAHRIGYLKDLSDAVTSMKKPIIAVVAGFALGGGFELALMCDIIYAAKDAKFGLPEITVGTIPGAGGTQRLIRNLGKQKAMDMILTSSTVTGEELCQLGLVAKVFSLEELLPAAIASAHTIASRSTPVIRLAKQSILNGEQTALDVGLQLERVLYYSSFSLEDRTEGMAAFVEKRPPVFKDM